MDNFHKGTNCDFCNQKEIVGTRYACLVCINYDLCKSCFLSKRISSNHKSYHPVQLIKAPSSEDKSGIFWCPYCGSKEYSVSVLIKHLRKYHADCGYPVRCPVCLATDKPRAQFADLPLLDHLLKWHVKVQSSSRSNGKPTAPETVECSICIENLPTGKGTTYLQCSHGFHSSCIDEWLENNSTCPVCRAWVD